MARKPANAASDVERYYYFIYLWTQLTNRFGAFRKAEAHTIHRGLNDPETGEWSTSTVHRMIAAATADLGQSDAGIRALDAGSGYGGTCMDMARMLGGRWHGITISETQRAIAARNATALGLADRVTFALASFDDPLPERYDLVYGIESLIHSADPSRTIANLAAALAPGGRLIIVDDMPVEDVPAEHADDLATFKHHWRCPVMPSVAGWSAHLRAAGLEIERTENLTPYMGTLKAAEVAPALEKVARKSRWRDKLGLRLVSEAQIGGLMLERLCAVGAVRYTMIVARKPH